MSVNKNSSNYNGEQSLDEADKCNNSAEIIVTKNPTGISEEKKQQIREKNKLAMQKRRASFSEEKKQQLREQERLKRQQKRDTQSIEEREAFNLKQRQRRANFANLSDEDRAIIRKRILYSIVINIMKINCSSNNIKLISIRTAIISDE